MSTLSAQERSVLERFLRMETGYVLHFSDLTFGEFVLDAVGLDIHAQKYTTEGTSKAKRLRAFWKLEDDYTVGRLLSALIDYAMLSQTNPDAETRDLADRCQSIAARLMAGGLSLDELKGQAETLNASHLANQIRRMEAAIETDPSLAIGTAKELIETCCKTILAESGRPVDSRLDVPALIKATVKELPLVPEGVPDASRGADAVKRLLSGLGTIGNSLAELRNLYGTGHGKHGSTPGVGVRHAKLAVGAAATLVTFLFETHMETTA